MTNDCVRITPNLTPQERKIVNQVLNGAAGRAKTELARVSTTSPPHPSPLCLHGNTLRLRYYEDHSPWLGEWLVFLHDTLLAPAGAGAWNEPPSALTFDHALVGRIDALSAVPGDRWRAITDGDSIHIKRTGLPCPACWIGGVRMLVPRSAAYRIEHPNPLGNIDLANLHSSLFAREHLGADRRCREGGWLDAPLTIGVQWPPAEPLDTTRPLEELYAAFIRADQRFGYLPRTASAVHTVRGEVDAELLW